MTEARSDSWVSRGRERVVVVASAIASFACWSAWMGWDLFYDVNPITGDASGPYEPWQILGSAISLLVLVLIVGWTLNHRPALVAYGFITAAYVLGFCISANLTGHFYPDGGANLWPIGALMLLVGAGAGIFIVGGLISLLRYAIAGRTGRKIGADDQPA